MSLEKVTFFFKSRVMRHTKWEIFCCTKATTENINNDKKSWQ